MRIRQWISALFGNLGRNMGRQAITQWVGDFETTTRADDCRVWGWGLCEIGSAETAWDVEMGGDIKSFLERCAKMPAVIWFHNLRFDGMFIMDYLLRNGYEHTTDRYPRKGHFATLISNEGAFYTITVTWPNGKRTEFRDSAKKFPNMGVKAVAQTFKLPEQKGDIDYHSSRPVGHKLTREERKYIASDVLIISKALRTQFSAGMTKLTVGSDALHEYKTIVGKAYFDTMWPVLPETMDTEIRAAYRGGFTYVAKRFQGLITRPGIVYDVNSLYPSVMYDRMLPYGEPIFHRGLPEATKEYPLFIVSITFTAKLKKNHIPCIQVKGSSRFTETEYQEVIREPVTLTCSSVDLALWEEHYDLDILSYNGGWSFHGVQGVFCEFIDKWNDVKMKSEGGMRLIAKLMLNNLYGKYATNPCVTAKVPVLDPETDTVKLVMGEPETRSPVYTAMGVFITAYARDMTIRAAQDQYDVFAYADTDSLHLLIDEDPEGLDVDPHKLGAWKREYKFKAGLFVRAKTYTEQLFDESHVTHIAGLPTKISEQLTFDDFVGGRKFTGKLQPHRVPGGVVLQDVGFTMPNMS